MSPPARSIARLFASLPQFVRPRPDTRFVAGAVNDKPNSQRLVHPVYAVEGDGSGDRTLQGEAPSTLG